MPVNKSSTLYRSIKFDWKDFFNPTYFKTVDSSHVQAAGECAEVQNKIIILPQEVSNKIAAGEVVERPASVVKELLENALDAGASKIEVEIEEAGRRLIKVSDDGEGMTETDLKLACLRHATSKIKEAADLSNIITLGFRGEALASIAAVSYLKISASRRGEMSGHTIEVDGGKIRKMQEAARSSGTTVEVRNLFFNTPARLKFLKSPATEIANITRIVTELALAYPMISFRLIHKGQEIINVAANSSLVSTEKPHGQSKYVAAEPRCGSGVNFSSADSKVGALQLQQRRKETFLRETNLKERIDVLLGKDLAHNFIPVSYEMPSLKIRGFIAKAGFGQATHNNQYTFVNGRPVRDKIISHAIIQGYHTFLADKQFAPLVLFIETLPGSVDVNVHPAKREIRFSNGALVHDAVVKAIKETVCDKACLPKLPTENKSSTLYSSAKLTEDYSGKVRDAGASQTTSGKYTVPKSRPFDKRSFEEKVASGEWGLLADKNITAPSLFQETEENAAQATRQLQAVQLKNTYIISSDEDGLFIIDQHAAHERVLFDELSSNLKSKNPEKQKLLLPMTLNLNKADAILLSEHKELFQNAGFDIEEFGRDSFMVQSYPVVLGKVDIAEVFDGILKEISQLEIATNGDEKKTKFMASIACHSAVRAGDKLSPQEINSILQRLWKTTSPYTCPHGRPTLIKMNWTELEKRFKRK